MLQPIINKLFFAYLLLLPIQAVFIFDEKYLNGAKWQYGTGTIYAVELLFWLIVFGSWLILLGKKQDKSPIKNFITSSWNLRKCTVVILWLFTAWASLSLIWAPEKSSAFYLWIKLMQGVAFFLIANSLNINKKNLTLPWSIAGAMSGLLAFGQFITQSSASNKWLGLVWHQAGRLGDIVIETSDGRWLRAYSTFSHPNILGGFCAFGLLATIDLAFSKQEKNSKLLLLLTIANSLGLFFSFSRTAWLATAIGLALMAVTAIKNKLLAPLKLIIIVLLVCLSMSFIFSSLIIARTNLDNRLEQKSVTERTIQISDGWQVIQKQPLWGTGLNNYTYYQATINPQLAAHDLQPVHNLYLLIMAELGIVGLLLLFFFLMTISLRVSKNTLAWGWLMPILIIGLFDHYLWTQYIGIIMFWLILTIFYKNRNIID